MILQKLKSLQRHGPRFSKWTNDFGSQPRNTQRRLDFQEVLNIPSENQASLSCFKLSVQKLRHPKITF